MLPYTADFERYGWNSLSSRCNTLGNSYNTTERKLFFVQRDHLGSTIALTDSTGNVVQSYTYDVYGTPYIATGSGFTQVRDFVGNLHGNDRFYTGREYEVSTGLYYYRARFYSPELGRFISRDPIGMADQVNLYAYVGNSPMIGVDPSGLNSKPIVNEVFDVLSTAYDWTSNTLSAIDIYDMIHGAGAGLAGGGAVIVATTAGTCATTTTITTTCIGVAIEGPLPAITLCIPTGIVAGAFCGATGFGALAAGAGGYLMTIKGESGSGGGGKSSNQVQKDIEKGKAPGSVDRLDKDVWKDGKNIDPAHIHFKDDSALLKNGAWKHGGKDLTNKEIEWLKGIGWDLPK